MYVARKIRCDHTTIPYIGTDCWTYCWTSSFGVAAFKFSLIHSLGIYALLMSSCLCGMGILKVVAISAVGLPAFSLTTFLVGLTISVCYNWCSAATYLEHRPATVQCAKFMSRRKSDVRKRNFLRRSPGLVSKRYTAQYFLYILEALTYQER
jgi:hypothetical protein